MPTREPSRRPPLGGTGRAHALARWRRRKYRRRRAVAALVVVLIASLAFVLVASGGGRRGHAPQRPAGGTAAVQARRDTGPGSIRARELRTDRRILSYTGYIRLGAGQDRDVALTFDDGPGPFTPRILAALERLRAKATFFEIGRQVREYPQLTARLARAGMVIGDHTEDHPPLAQLSPREQAAEIDEAADAIRAAGAPQPLLFRPPYGSFDDATLDLLRAREMLMALWTVDTSDYARPGVRRIIYTALSGARPGAIILFHDGGGNRSQTLAALPRIIERLRQRGYRLVTIPQLLRDDPPPVSQPAPQSLSGD
jgi:peptidoglycan-N-acetylglucosamine deacetylase